MSIHRLVYRTANVAALLTIIVGRTSAQPLDPTFNPNADAEVYTIVAQSDGKLLVGGNFTTLGGASRSRLARLDVDGTADHSLNLALDGTVRAIALQSDGKIVVGGSFTSAGTTPRNGLLRINADGSLDSTFNPAANSTTRALAVQPDGKILVAGLFSNIAGAARTGFARLLPDGSVDTAFDVPISGSLLAGTFTVQGLALQADGRILFCGNFNAVAGQPRTGIARVLESGVLDLSFNPPTFNSSMPTMIVLPDGKIFLAGNFSRFTAPALNYTARLNADGSLDPTFTPPTLNGSATGAARQADGKLVVGGFFTVVGGVSRGSLVRLNASGTLDPTFNPEISGSFYGATGSPNVNVVAIPPGPPHLVVGGAFTVASGQTRNGLTRFGTPLPTVTLQPASVLCTEGATVNLTVAATGDPLRYQWKRNGVDLPGATIATLALGSLRTAGTGIYTVTIANGFGSVTTTPASVSFGPPQAPRYSFSTFAGRAVESGFADGTGDAARFIFPSSLGLDSAGVLYVTDNRGLRRIAPNGSVTTLPQSSGRGQVADSAGNLYYHSAGQIRKLSPTGATTIVAGSLTTGYRDGAAATALFSSDLRGTALDRTGRLFVVDSGNAAIRRLDPSGTVSTVTRFDDYGPFLSPQGLTIDPGGTLFFTDYYSGGIGEISPAGIPSFFITNLTAAIENLPPVRAQERLTGIAADLTGNLFVTDSYNNVIRKISAQGAVSTIGGIRGVRGTTDGSGAAALFSTPFEIAVDSAGTLYVADTGNHTIRKGIRESVPLSIAAHPQAVHTAAGSPISFSLETHGDNLVYQWEKDGAPIAGATHATLRLALPAGPDMGYYSVVVGSAGTSIESRAAILTVSTPGVTGRLINVATRGLVPPGDALTPGFVLRGDGTKQLVVRGVGPTLLRFGLGGSLADPRFELAPLGGATLVANDDWSTGGATLAAASVAVGAFPLDPDSKDSATLAAVATSAGRAYTVRITGPDAIASGLALAEIYDADSLTSPVQLVNVSTRGFVGTGANALVPGFVVGGGGPLQLLIRAVGPGLAPFGLTGLLADPQIIVTPLGQTTPVATNDNWGGLETLRAAFAAAGAFPLPPDSKDAAVLVRLPPGAYTVTVSGVANTTGTALVEIYDVP